MGRKQPLTRRESQQQTRQALIEAAERELLRTGIYETSIRRICTTAGFTLGAFYSNFSTKDELLMEVVEGHARRIFALLDEVVAASVPGGKEDMAQRIEMWLGELQQDDVLTGLSLEFALYARHNESFRILYGASKNAWRNRLTSSLERLFSGLGVKPRIPLQQMVLGLWALWHGFAMESIVPGTGTADRVVPLFLEALLESSRSGGSE